MGIEVNISLEISNAFFHHPEQEDGDDVTVTVEGDLVRLRASENVHITLTLEELDAVYHFAMREAKRQGYQLE